MKILEKLQDIIWERSKGLEDDQFLIRGQWGIDLLFKPNVYERTFQYQLIVAQTIRQGACYCYLNDHSIDKALMGLDARNVSPKNTYLRIALLDAAYSVLYDKSLKDFIIEGYSSQKALSRAEIVVSEVLFHLPEKTKGKKTSVVNVGVIGNIIKSLKEKGLDVYGTDLDKNLINHSVSGVIVQDGKNHTLRLVEECDLALITGMTLSTHTLEEIIDVGKRSKTKIVMFAETGAWFAQTYCDVFGLNAVISEPFPFYIFEGQSIIRLHRSSR